MISWQACTTTKASHIFIMCQLHSKESIILRVEQQNLFILLKGLEKVQSSIYIYIYLKQFNNIS